MRNEDPLIININSYGASFNNFLQTYTLDEDNI